VARLLVKSEPGYEQVVFAEVLVPFRGDVDGQGDAVSAAQIKQAAYNFLKANRINKIDVMHNNQENGAYIVESFVARANDSDGFIEGAWVVGIKVEDPITWNQILKGEINAVSPGGYNYKKHLTEVKATVTKSVSGITDVSTHTLIPSHSHQYNVVFRPDRKIVPTNTDFSLDHSHRIIKGSATELNLDHAHRFVVME